MRYYHGLASIVVFGFISLFIGCGGGGGGEINGGLGDCNNATVKVGETIKVPVARAANVSFTRNSLNPESASPVTILIGGKPVDPKDITFNEDGSVEILVTTLTSTIVNVEAGEGAQIKTLCRNIKVLPAESKVLTAACKVDGDCSGGQVCKDGSCVASAVPPSADQEVIAPTATAGSATDEDGDGVANTIDACPGTAPGTVVDATGCLPPPDEDHDGVKDADDKCLGTLVGTPVDLTPGLKMGCALPPPAATVNSFEVTKVTGAAAMFSTWEIKWTVANAKAAYLWGDVFNRDATDAGITNEGERCLKIGDSPHQRYLVTSPLGLPISTDDTDDHKKYEHYLTGTLCNPSAAVGDAHWCSFKSPSTAWLPSRAAASAVPWETAWLDDQSLPESRFGEDSLMKKGLYFKQLPQKIDIYMGDKNMQTVTQIDPSLLFPAENNPDCRIDLKNADGSVIATDASDPIYTRSLINHGTVCLVVQGMDDAWKTTCKDVTAPEVAITGGSGVSVSSSKPKVTVDFIYSNAVSVPVVAGCPSIAGSDAKTDAKGHGHFVGECTITGETMKVDLMVTGIGAANTDKKSYEITLGDPTPTLEFYGKDNPIPDDSGPVTLQYDVKRSCQVAEGGHVVSCGTVPWVKNVTFEGSFTDGTITDKPVLVLSDVSGTKTATKSYQNTKWAFKVLDFDGINSWTAEKGTKYNASFTVIRGASTFNQFYYEYDRDHCGELEDCTDDDCCDDTGADGNGVGCGCHHDSDDSVWNCRNYRVKVSALLNAQNIKQAQVACHGLGESAAAEPTEPLPIDPASTAYQSSIPWEKTVGGERISCTFTATGYGDPADNFSQTFTWDRTAGWCDGPDLEDGVDHDDAGFDD